MLVCLLISGCTRADAKKDIRVWNVAPRSMFESYLDGSHKWTGEHVQMYFLPETYQVTPEGVHWHAANPAEAPAIVVELDRPPESNTKGLTIRGRVRGLTHDDKARGSRLQWHIRIGDATIVGP